MTDKHTESRAKLPLKQLQALLDGEDKRLVGLDIGRVTLKGKKAVSGYWWQHCHFTKTIFRGGSWFGASFDRCTFTGVHFVDVDLTKVFFYGCTFTDCKFDNVTITSGFMDQKCLIYRARFGTLRLFNDGATWNATIDGARFDRLTVTHDRDFGVFHLALGGNIRNANFARMTGLHNLNLSGAELFSSVFPRWEEYCRRFDLERREGGVVAYKTFGAHYSPPHAWLPLEVGKTLEDPKLEMDRRFDCDPGINVAGIEWVLLNGRLRRYQPGGPQDPGYYPHIWRVLVPSDAKVCFPYTSDGKIRADRVVLLDDLGPAPDIQGFCQKWGFRAPPEPPEVIEQ